MCGMLEDPGLGHALSSSLVFKRSACEPLECLPLFPTFYNASVRCSGSRFMVHAIQFRLY